METELRFLVLVFIDGLKVLFLLKDFHLSDSLRVCVCVSFQPDSIFGFHSNTHIPVVVGAQMRYEVTGDPLYKVKFNCILLLEI